MFGGSLTVPKHFHEHHCSVLSQGPPDTSCPDLTDSAATTKLAWCSEIELRDGGPSHVVHRARFLIKSSIRLAGLSLELYDNETEKFHSSLAREECLCDPSQSREGNNDDGEHLDMLPAGPAQF